MNNAYDAAKACCQVSSRFQFLRCGQKGHQQQLMPHDDLELPVS